MTIAEQIYKIVLTLPERKAAEVLTIVESMQTEPEQKDRDNLPDDLDELDRLSWPEFVQAVAGSWGDDFPTLEEIRAGEGQDAPRESL